MPVQINEIVITATVSDTATQNVEVSELKALSENTSAEIVKACVVEVLRILKEKEER